MPARSAAVTDRSQTASSVTWKTPSPSSGISTPLLSVIVSMQPPYISENVTSTLPAPRMLLSSDAETPSMRATRVKLQELRS